MKYLPNFDGVFEYLREFGCDETVMLTLGAGSITKFSFELAEAVKEKRSEK